MSLAVEDVDHEIVAAMDAELRRGWHFNDVNAHIEQKRRLAHDKLPEAHFMQGLGVKKGTIDPHSYHYWGKRLGYKCWHDKQFLREYFRDNEESRVKTTSRKIQLGYSPGPRWTKKFN